MVFALIQAVFQYKTLAVNVVGDQIQIAIVIQIGVGRTVGKARLVQSPGFRYVFKR